MANPTLSYFLPPQWEFEHETGPILLGNIISNPKVPQYALNADERLPLPPFFLNKRKPSFKVTLTVDSTQTAGLDLSLFSLFGFDGGFDVERGKKQTYTINAVERLTQEINPRTEWVEECFKLPAIVNHLQDKGYKDLYLITGIMAAMSATVESHSKKKQLFGGKVGANLAAAGVPLGVGFHASASNDNEAEASIGKSDFILAYRLRKITYKKRHKLKNMVDLHKGAVLDKDSTEPLPEVVYYPEGVKLEEDDVEAEEVRLASVTAHDEENRDEFEFVIPVDEE
jgi:hypothetical protein